MATATKEKPSKSTPITMHAPTPRPTLSDEIRESTSYLEMEADRASMLAAASNQLLWQIELRSTNLTPGDLRLTPTERQLLKAGGVEFENDFELSRILGKVRSTRLSLEEFSFDRLADAESALADAKKAVATTTADMSDLDLDGDNPEPAMVRQLAKIQKKLSDLRSTEQQAAGNVAYLKSLLDHLEQTAPQCLQDLADIRKREAELNPKFQEHQNIEAEVLRITQILACSIPGGVFDPERRNARRSLVEYALEHCPNVVGKEKHGTKPECDAELLREHFAELKEKLPSLKADCDRLKAECDQIMVEADVKGPIHDWIEQRRLTTELLK